MELFKEFAFEASHCLPGVTPGHKCARLHGHSFRVTVHIRGPVSATTGWVQDFADLAALVKPVLDQLDHRHLNEIAGLENPTSENIARWLWRNLKPRLPQLTQIVVRESETSGCIYRGEDEG